MNLCRQVFRLVFVFPLLGCDPSQTRAIHLVPASMEAQEVLVSDSGGKVHHGSQIVAAMDAIEQAALSFGLIRRRPMQCAREWELLSSRRDDWRTARAGTINLCVDSSPSKVQVRVSEITRTFSPKADSLSEALVRVLGEFGSVEIVPSR